MTTDQKRALGLGVGGIGLFLGYQRLHRGTPATAPGPVDASAQGQVAPYTPQNPVTLDPGQSLYDPNSQGFVNTPTAPSAGATLLPDPNTAAAAGPGYVVNVNYPATHTTAPQAKRKKPAVRKPAVTPKSKVKPKTKAAA